LLRRDFDTTDGGIVYSLTTQHRGNFLIPPLTLRSLPHPQGDDVYIDAERDGDTWRVTVYGQSEALDPGRFTKVAGQTYTVTLAVEDADSATASRETTART
jgi:hypothetical protein